MDDLDALAEQIPDEVLDYIDSLESKVEQLTSDVTTLNKRLGAEGAEEDGDPIAKALSQLPDDVATIFKAQQTRLSAAEAALEASRIAKANSEWVAKAAAYDGIVDNPAEFGSQLRELAESNPDLAKSIDSALRTAATRFSKAALFGEVGHGAPVPGSAEDKVESIAKAMTQSDPNLDLASARAQVWEAHPELYEQHIAAQRARAREV